MGVLVERYGLAPEQERQLIRDGLIQPSFVVKFEIWQHFEAVKDGYKLVEDAVFDCQMHFKTCRSTVFEAIKMFRA